MPQQLSISIPDAAVDEVLDALADEYGFANDPRNFTEPDADGNRTLINTRAQKAKHARRVVRSIVLQSVQRKRAQEAARAAADAVSGNDGAGIVDPIA